MTRARFPRFWEAASFDATARRRGRSARRCAFAAIVTAVSVIPPASFARVLPVVGAIMRYSLAEAAAQETTEAAKAQAESMYVQCFFPDI